MAEKRKKNGQFAKGSGGGSKRKRAKSSKGTKRGGSLESRVSRLEHNQKLLVGVVDGMETRLSRVEGAVSKIAGAMGQRFASKKRRRSKKSAGAGI